MQRTTRIEADDIVLVPDDGREERTEGSYCSDSTLARASRVYQYRPFVVGLGLRRKFDYRESSIVTVLVRVVDGNLHT